MKKYNKLEVEWEDITFFRGEYNKEDNFISQRILTIGHFVKEDETHLILALSLELTEPYRVIDVIKIPKVNIIKKRILK